MPPTDPPEPRPASLADLIRVMEPFKGVGKDSIIVGYARDRLRWQPSYPEIAGALGLTSHPVAIRRYEEWTGWSVDMREYWSGQIDGALAKEGLEVTA